MRIRSGCWWSAAATAACCARREASGARGHGHLRNRCGGHRDREEVFPNVSCGYDDPRVAVHIADGSEFIKDRPGYYDVIIVDSTDPGGPGAPLFGEQFYRDMKKALRPGGVIATQAESPYLLPDIVQRLYKVSEQVFRSVGYASILVPTYPTGTIGACVAGDRDDIASPARPVPSELAAKLRYYNSKIHEAAFANPSFVKRLFD